MAEAGGITTYPFYRDGRRDGSLTAQRQGEKTVFTITTTDDGAGIYRAYLCGSAGRLSIGSLLPQEGGLFLKRTLSESAILPLGKLQKGEGVLVYLSPKAQVVPEGWRQEPNPEVLFQDPVLRQSLRQASGALVQEAPEGGGLLLALPICGGLFPLTPLFCFATVRWLGDRYYAIYKVS